MTPMAKKSRTPEGCPEISLPLSRPKVNIYADTETFLWSDGIALWEHKHEDGFSNLLAQCDVVPWLLGAYMPAIENRQIGKVWINQQDYRPFVSYEHPHPTFFERLKEYWDLGFLPVVWFHNASYDLTACIENTFKALDPDLKIYFTTKENKGFINGLMESPKYGFKVKFGDTLLYKRISLEKIGKMFKSPKGEIPYKMMDLSIRNSMVEFTEWDTGLIGSIPLKMCIDYVVQDTYLLMRYHKQLEKETELITIAVNGYKTNKIRTSTQGVHARSLLDMFMHKNQDGKFENVFKFVVDKEEGVLMQRSLTGGFTSLDRTCHSHICSDEELITAYDCNSMYPYVMTGGIPCGRLMDEEPKNCECVEWVCVSAKDVKWNGIMSNLITPPIPTIRQTKRMDMPTKIYLTRTFLEFVKENADGEFVEHYSKFQRITDIAGKFVNYMYDVRKNLKRDHEELMERIRNDEYEGEELENKLAEWERMVNNEKGVKTTMNSLYGKMCEKAYLSQTVYINGKFKRVFDDEAEYKCTLSGAYIALTGRLILYRKIKQSLEAGLKFLYADTDSVIFAYRKDEHEKIEEVFGFHNGELGEWKKVGEWHEFHSPGKKKKYTLLNHEDPESSKIKLSGITEKIYITALKNGLKTDREKTINDLRYIFQPTSNVIFREAKNIVARTMNYDQQVIHPIDVSSNPSLGFATAEVYKRNGKYVLEIYGKEKTAE